MGNTFCKTGIIFADTTTGSNINLVTDSVSSSYTLSSYIDATISSLKSVFGDKLDGDISKEFVSLNGKDAYIISYTISQNDIKVKATQICFIDNNTAYILTITSRNENYNQENIDTIISSFKK